MDTQKKYAMLEHTVIGRETRQRLEAEASAQAEFASDHWKDQPRDKGKFAETPGDGPDAADSSVGDIKKPKKRARNYDEKAKTALDSFLKNPVKTSHEAWKVANAIRLMKSADMRKTAIELGIDERHTTRLWTNADVADKIREKLASMATQSDMKITTKPPEPAKSEPAEKKSGGFSDFTVQSSSEGGKAVYKLLGKKNGSWETVNQFDNEMDAKESMAETRKKHPTSRQTYQHKDTAAIDLDDDIKDLYDKALQPEITVEKIEKTIRSRSEKLTKRELASAAKDFGISRSLPNKEAILKAIIQKITDRKGAYERAKV